ncbi:MAG: hypothetical protein JSS23_09135, partial [Proteobacteria bacterium]|nr:hypothetical protein [Pseudomonadota bacterium]
MKLLMPGLRTAAEASLTASGKVAAKDLTEKAVQEEAERIAAQSFTRRNILNAVAANPAALHMTAEQGRGIIAAGGTPADVAAMALPVLAINSILAALPISARGPWLKRTLTGAAIGGVSNVGATAAINPFLPENMRTNAFEAGGPGALMGALFGGLMGGRPIIARETGAKPSAEEAVGSDSADSGAGGADASAEAATSGVSVARPPPAPHAPGYTEDAYPTGFSALSQPERFTANVALNDVLPRINTLLAGTKGKSARPAVKVLDSDGVATDEVMQFTRPELQENPAAAIDALSRVNGSDAVNGERDALIGWLRSHNDAIASNDQLSRASAAMTPALRNALPMLNDGQRADVAMELGVSPAALDQAWRAAAQTDTLPATGEAMAEPTGQLNSATTARVQAMIRRMMPEHDDIPAVDMSVAEGAVPRVDGGNNLGTPAGAIRPAASAVANPLQAEAEAAVPPADPLMSPSVSAPAREAANSVVASDGMSQATARVRDAAVDDPTVIPPEGQSNTMIQRLAELRADPQSPVARRAAAFVGQSAALARAVRTAASARAAFTRELDAQMQTLNASGDISADSDAAFRTLRSQMQAADAEVAARNERVANLITDVSQDLSGVSDEGAVADLTTVEPAQNGGVAPTLRARRAAQTDRLSIPLLDGDGRPLMLPPPSTRPLSEIQSAMDAVLRDRTSALSDVFGRIDSGVTQREHRNLLNRAGGVVRHSEVELARLQREMNAAVARADHMQALNALNNEELASAFTANKVRMKSLDESIRALEARRKVGEAISPQEQVLQNAWVHEYNELATANRHIEQVRKLPDASRGDATQDPFGGSAQATEQVSTSAADRYTNEGLRGLFAGPRPPDTLGALIRQITRWQSGAPWARKIEQVVMRWMPQTRVKVSAREEIAQITGHEDAFAAYDPYTDTIHLLDTSLDGKNVVHAAYHEAMHAVTLRAIRAVERKPERTTPQMQAAVARLQELHDYAKQHLGKTFDDGTGSHQWYDDLAEFASEAQANPLLRAGLEGIGRKGVVRRIFDAVLRLVGLGRLAPKSRAVLAEVMAATDELLPYNRQMFDKFQQIDRINRGLGDAAPMRKVQLPGAKRGETAEEYAVRIRNERTADPSVPRDPSNTAEKLDKSTAKAAVKDAERSILFGRHVIDTGNEVAAVAMPTTEGYKLIYSDRYVRDDGRQVFD